MRIRESGCDSSIVLSKFKFNCEVTEGLEQEITKDIETGKKPKKPRTEAQKAAFVKAREALAEKRKAAAEEKASKKKKPGRPPKVKEEPVEKPKKKEKKVQYVLEESSSSSSEEEEEEIVYVKRSKGQKKPRKKKGQKIVYVSSSSEEDLAEHTHDYSQMLAPDPQLASLYSFV
jgi:hypothetical protein